MGGLEAPRGRLMGAYQDVRPGPSWVLMVLLNLVENRLIFTSKWNTAWHHGMRDVNHLL